MSATKIASGWDVKMAVAAPYRPDRAIAFMSSYRLWDNDIMGGGVGAFCDHQKILQKSIEFITKGLPAPSVIQFGGNRSTSAYSEFRDEWTNAGVTLADNLNSTWDGTTLQTYEHTLAIVAAHPIMIFSGGPGQGTWYYLAGAYLASELVYQYMAQGGRLFLEMGPESYYHNDPNMPTRILSDIFGWTFSAPGSSYTSRSVGKYSVASPGDEGIISTNAGRRGLRTGGYWLDTYDPALTAAYYAEWVDSTPGLGDYGNFIGTWNPNGVGL